MDQDDFRGFFASRGVEDVFLSVFDGRPLAACVAPYPIEDTPAKADSCRVGSFARQNRYRAFVDALKLAVSDVARAAGLRKADFSIRCNSRIIDEKTAAINAGAGHRGRNSLLITEKYGPRALIAIVELPCDLIRLEVSDRVPSSCADCRACVDACPTGALDGSGRVDLGKCLQYYASRAIPMPRWMMARSGLMLYGCDVCTRACPRGGAGVPSFPVSETGPGEWVGVAAVLSLDEAGLAALFKGTALGMAFVERDALRRNALVAVGNGGMRDLVPIVRDYESGGNAVLSGAASYALETLAAGNQS